MKVKQLEWYTEYCKGDYCDFSVNGSFKIMDDYDHFDKGYVLCDYNTNKVIGCYRTKKESKQKAQELWEQLIFSCLEEVNDE